MKRFTPILLALAMLLTWSGVQAQQTITQSTTTRKIAFLLVQSADHITGLTAATPTVTISKNGAAFAAPAGTVAELANGWYVLTPTSADTGTLGPLLLHATAASADPVDKEFNVEAVNRDDVSLFGLTGVGTLANQTSSATAVAAISTKLGTPAGASVSADIAANTTSLSTLTTRIPGTVQPQTGDAFARLGAPVGASISADVAAVPTTVWANGTRTLTAQSDSSGVTTLLTRLAQTLLFDGSGNLKSNVAAYTSLQDPATIVWGATASSYNTALTMGNKLNAAASAGDPWSTALPGSYGSGTAGNIVGNNLNATVSSRQATVSFPSNFALLAIDGSGRLLLQPTQTGVTIPTVTALSGNVTVGGYASGQDPATLVLAATIDGSITMKQAILLNQSIISGKFSVVRDTTAKTLTVTYKRADGTTTLAVLVTTYSDTALTLATGRAVTFSNLP